MLSQRLLERGINVQPVTHPAVPAKEARLRYFLTAMHTDAEMTAAVEATVKELNSVRAQMSALRPLL